MLLKVSGVARLARDVEVRYSQSGSVIANFSIVSSKKYKTQSGEQKEDTTFVDCTAFGRLAEICNQYLRKGSQIYIIGELKLDTWEKDGQKRSKHGITLESMEMLGSKQDNEPKQGTPPQNSYSQPVPEQNNYTQPTPPQSQQGAIPEVNIDEDSIPFNRVSTKLALTW